MLFNAKLYIGYLLGAALLSACGGGVNDTTPPASSASSASSVSSLASSVSSIASSSVASSKSSSSLSSATSSSSSSVISSSSATSVFSISLTVGPGGALKPSANVNVAAGQTQIFSFVADTGFKLASANGCGVVVAADTISTAPITSNCNLSVAFTKVGSLADQLKLTDVGLIRCIDNYEAEAKQAVTASSIISLVCENTFQSVNSIAELNKFSNLQSLSLSGNRLSGTVDFSILPKLTSLNISNNYLQAINVSKNTLLTKLNASQNLLTQIDIGVLSALTELSLSRNQLTQVDVSKNIALTQLDVSDNKLTQLNVTPLTQLLDLNVSRNSLTALDTTKNLALQRLNMGWNSIAALSVKHLVNLRFLNV